MFGKSDFFPYFCLNNNKMKGHILEHKDSLDFIFGGNAIFTVKNTKSENRFTFKVTKHKKEDIFFVKVLTGPDKYEFIGSIYRGSTYRHSKKSRITSEAQSVKVFEYLMSKLNSNTLPEFIQIWHEGRCGRCGRTLTVPSSISSGFGPECVKMISRDRNEDRDIKLTLIGI